jgi:hypothetical protein
MWALIAWADEADSAACCCRCNEALREAIALEQAHMPALLAVAALQLHNAHADPESHGVELALAAGHAAKDAQPAGSAAAWALLAAVYELQGGPGCREASNCRCVGRG